MAARRAGALATHTQYSLSPLATGGITTIHDLSFLIGPQWFQPKDRFLMSRTVPASVKRARAVLSVSETTKADLERLIPASIGKITVTPNALGRNIRLMSPSEAEQRRRGLGVEGPYVLSVSTRWPRKNMELAVRAVDLLPASLPHRLVLTGKSGWGDQSKGSRTQAVGYVSDDDLSALYLGASAYLCPSLYEGFGIPLLEAMACGCPVICSTGGALPEVAAGAARVVTSWDPADWAAALSNVLESSEEGAKLAQAGRLRVQDYSWKETARKTLDVYRTVGKV
jgi:alpha-1,3-rhamnosyl/mannosyltransferase